MGWRFPDDALHLRLSRFELVILASQRSYDLKSGSEPEVPYDEDDKTPVIALKELFANKLNHEKLYKLALKRMAVFSGTGYSGIPSSMESEVEALTKLMNENSTNEIVADSSSGISFEEDEEE